MRCQGLVSSAAYLNWPTWVEVSTLPPGQAQVGDGFGKGRNEVGYAAGSGPPERSTQHPQPHV